jgi:putative transcriptional regulator
MNNLKLYRTKSKLSQKQLADLTNISAPRVSQLEQSLNQPSLKTAQRIIAALNFQGAKCSINDVFPPEDLKQAS